MVLHERQPKRRTSSKIKRKYLHSNVIIGSTFKDKNRAGTNPFISRADLKTFYYNDVFRILDRIPMISVQEDGFGYKVKLGISTCSLHNILENPIKYI